MTPAGQGGGAPPVTSIKLPLAKRGDPPSLANVVKENLGDSGSPHSPQKAGMARKRSSGFVSVTQLGGGRSGSPSLAGRERATSDLGPGMPVIAGHRDPTVGGEDASKNPAEMHQYARAGRTQPSPLGPAPAFPARPTSSGDSSANSSRSQSKTNSPRMSRMSGALMQRMHSESISPRFTPRSDGSLKSPKGSRLTGSSLSLINFSPRRTPDDDGDDDNGPEGGGALKAVMARRASVQEEERMAGMLRDLIKGTQAMTRGDTAIPSLKKSKYLRKESSGGVKERVPFSIKEALSGKRHAHKDTVDPEKIGTGLTHTDTSTRHRSPLKAARIMAENINHKAKTRALFSSNPSGETMKNESYLQDVFIKKPLRHDVQSMAISDAGAPKRRSSISYAGSNQEWEDVDAFEHEWFPYTIFTTSLESNFADREFLQDSIKQDKLVTESFEKLMYKDHVSTHSLFTDPNMFVGSKGETLEEPFLRRGVPIPHSETYHSSLTPSLAGRGSISKDKSQPQSAGHEQRSAIVETLDNRKYKVQGEEVVKEVSLPGNKLKDHGVRMLVREIKKKTRLHTATKLDLSLNSIHDEGALEIAMGLRELNLLKVLNVSNNCIGPRGTLSIARSCHKVPSLAHVDFSSNFIGPDGAEALSVMISNPNITWMDVSNNEIGDRGASHFGVALKTNKTLQVFHMSTCDIHHDGANALAEALKSNTALRELYLTGNMIKVSGAASLASMLMQNNTLKTLIIRWTNITNQGARYISAALEHNTGLQILDISNNQLTAAAVDGFANTLRYHNRTLTFLDLSKTTFLNDPDTCLKLRNAIWADTALVTLKLSEGDMDPKLHKECLKVLAAREELRAQGERNDKKATTKQEARVLWRPSNRLNGRENLELMSLATNSK